MAEKPTKDKERKNVSLDRETLAILDRVIETAPGIDNRSAAIAYLAGFWRSATADGRRKTPGA